MRRVAAVVLLLGVSWLGPAEGGERYRLLRLEGSYLKWGAPHLGTGATITYAVAEAARHDAAARNCGELAPLAPALARAGVGMADFLAELRAAFALWEDAADIRFEPATDAASANILIGAQAIPRGRAYANVDYTAAVDDGPHRLRRSLICLNPAAPWKIGFGGNPLAYDLRYVLAHEIGHAIGLDHPGGRGHLMAFTYDEDSRELSAGDADGVVALYGLPPPAKAASTRSVRWLGVAPVPADRVGSGSPSQRNRLDARHSPAPGAAAGATDRREEDQRG